MSASIDLSRIRVRPVDGGDCLVELFDEVFSTCVEFVCPFCPSEDDAYDAHRSALHSSVGGCDLVFDDLDFFWPKELAERHFHADEEELNAVGKLEPAAMQFMDIHRNGCVGVGTRRAQASLQMSVW